MAFDIMTVDDFLKQRKTPPLKRRREVLEAALDGLTKTVMAAGLKPLVIPSVVEKGVNAETEQDRIMDLFTLHTQAGFEGLIVKDAEAEYKFDRTRDWLKVKPTETWDLTIIRSVEGDGRLRGKLGAWWCEGEDSKGRKIAVRVGGGISDADRDEYWRNRADGRIIEVLGDALSKNKDGDTYSIRFPRWTERFRDHMGEKA
jgi:DNA ligase-1